MTFTIPEVFSHVQLSLREPRRAAQELLDWDIPDSAVWPIAVLAVVLLTLGAELTSALNPPPANQPAIYIAPIALALVALATVAATALGITVVGRLFGGKGQFLPALLVMSWLQFVWFCVLLPLGFLGFLPTALIDMLTLAVLLYMLWVMVSFVAVVHGFEGLGRALVVVILASLMASLVFMAAVGAVGVTVMGNQANG